MRVRPGGNRSTWLAPVLAVLVVTVPAAVVTRSRVATGRLRLSSSSRMLAAAGRSSWWLKVIWIH